MNTHDQNITPDDHSDESIVRTPERRPEPHERHECHEREGREPHGDHPRPPHRHGHDGPHPRHDEDGPHEGGPRRHHRGPFGPLDGGPGGHRGPGGPGRYGGPRGRGRARRGQVRIAALLLIAEQPRNGYQIMADLEELTDGRWRPSPGAVYPALNQLEDEGLIAASQGEGRKEYAITEAGQAEAQTWADKPRPWESEDGEGEQDAPDRPLREAYEQLRQAATGVLASGDEKLMAEAATVLVQARRDLYTLLAQQD